MRLFTAELFLPGEVGESTGSDVGSATLYPVALSLAKLSRWLFQCRQMQIAMDLTAWSASAEYTDPGGTDAASRAGDVASSEAEARDADLAPLIAEVQMVQWRPKTGGAAYADGQVSGSAEVYIEGNVSLAFFDRTFPDFYAVKTFEGEYYPHLVLSGSFLVYAIAGAASDPPAPGEVLSRKHRTYQFSSASLPPEDPAIVETGAANVSLDGELVEVHWWKYQDDMEIDESPDTTASTSVAEGFPPISITLHQFWGHNAGDGPIWGVVSGDKLRPNYEYDA